MVVWKVWVKRFQRFLSYLKRLFAIYLQTLLQLFEIVRSGIVSLSTFRHILQEKFSFFALIVSRIPPLTFVESFLLSWKKDIYYVSLDVLVKGVVSFLWFLKHSWILLFPYQGWLFFRDVDKVHFLSIWS